MSAPASAFYPHVVPNGYFDAGDTMGRCIVCHLTSGGGFGCSAASPEYPRCLNPFGHDFLNGPNGVPDNPLSPTDGLQWSQWLAERDSDGDGWSNGQELGDSYRLWPGGAASEPDVYRANPGFSSNEPASANLCSDSDRNDCAPSSVRGQCSDAFSGTGRYTCSCGTGSSGTGYRRTQSHNWSGSTPGTRRYDIRSFQSGCTDINECAVNPCGVGSCSESDPAAGYTCSCPGGYQFNGTTCVNINECLSNPCGPSGTGCTDMTPGYTCTCQAGFAFNGITCVVTDPCLADTDDCDPNATCTPAGASWTCACDMGWLGVGSVAMGTGDRCVDVNECATAGICGVGSCRNNAGSYTCTCPAGYLFDGSTCADINECVPDPCGIGGRRCNNTPGSFSCACNAGYMFNGATCIDINECAGDPCGEGDCIQIDPPGSDALGYACSCRGGYAFNGTTCEDIDECLTPEVSLCSENAVCNNSPGGFACICNDGFAGDGRSCLDVDECASETLNECFTNPSCTAAANRCCNNEEGSHVCFCPEGFEGSGVTCRDVDECAAGTLVCGAGEVCKNDPSGEPAECVCAPGFTRDEDTGDCVRGCGNGVRTAGEACDDGNTDDDDGCSAECEVEDGYACWEPPGEPDAPNPSECTDTCGDGLVQPSEQCDDAEANADVPDACRARCQLPACGDGIMDTGEGCDDGEANDDETANACRSNCVPAFCGDGVEDEGEACDPGGDVDLGTEACVACASGDGGTGDAGTTDAGITGGGGGCSTGGSGSAAWLVLLGLFIRRRD